MVRPDVSLVLACYNEAQIFTESVRRIISVLQRTDYTWEIILVDDQSQDETVALIKQALQQYAGQKLSAIYHQHNQGRGQTVRDGFHRAQGKIIGYLDIDLEIGEGYLPQFIQAVAAGNDVAAAWRIYDFNYRHLLRWLASKSYLWLQKRLLGLPFKDTEAGYKFFNQAAIMPLLKKTKNQGWFFDTEILALGFKKKLTIKEIPVAFVRRQDKTSTVRIIPDTLKYLQDLISFSKKFHD